MSAAREEQIEALKALAEFNPKLIDNINILIRELLGDRKEDTDQLLNSVLDGINWEISIIGATLPLINENEVKLEKEEINTYIMKLSEALHSEEEKDVKTAEAMREMICCFKQLQKLAEEY